LLEFIGVSFEFGLHEKIQVKQKIKIKYFKIVSLKICNGYSCKLLDGRLFFKAKFYKSQSNTRTTVFI
jgi:hypothetical protein